MQALQAPVVVVVVLAWASSTVVTIHLGPCQIGQTTVRARSNAFSSLLRAPFQHDICALSVRLDSDPENHASLPSRQYQYALNFTLDRQNRHWSTRANDALIHALIRRKSARLLFEADADKDFIARSIRIRAGFARSNPLRGSDADDFERFAFQCTTNVEEDAKVETLSLRRSPVVVPYETSHSSKRNTSRSPWLFFWAGFIVAIVFVSTIVAPIVALRARRRRAAIGSATSSTNLAGSNPKSGLDEEHTVWIAE